MPTTHILQAVARLPSVSTFPEDTCENVFNIGYNSEPSSAEVGDVLAKVRDFYTVIAAGAVNRVGFFISESISRVANACSVLGYVTDDLTGATPFGSPVNMINFTMATVAAGSPLPEEVALVISYNADLTDVPVSAPNPSPPPATIRPAQRRRGRTFLGPLTGISAIESGNRIRPTDQIMDDVTIAFAKMASDINDLADVHGFGIWSKTDGQLYKAIECHIDNAWDTQRRRGPDPTTSFTRAITS